MKGRTSGEGGRNRMDRVRRREKEGRRDGAGGRMRNGGTERQRGREEEDRREREGERSEEHTSELQSRPHISYAVFCLKKKKTKI